jgi:hypothetical protein
LIEPTRVRQANKECHFGQTGKKLGLVGTKLLNTYFWGATPENMAYGAGIKITQITKCNIVGGLNEKLVK